MDKHIVEARELVIRAREALRRGDKPSARQLGERAAFLAPDMEDVWLVLAASDPNPQDALAYARRALQINPHSTRARRGVAWASGQIEQAQASSAPSPIAPIPVQAAAASPLPKRTAYQTAVAMPALRPQNRSWLLPALLAGAGVFFLGLIALFALVANYPALTSIVNGIAVPPTVRETLWAPADIAKPELTPIDDEVAVQLEDTPAATPVPTLAPPTATAVPTDAPGNEPAGEPTVIPAVTETPGEMVMELVPDTPTSEYVAPTPGISVGNGERWIDVDLTNQMVYAYEGDVLVNSFLVSTGTWLTPTVTGEYKIYVKVRMQDMSGPGYYLRDVPYVMFFKGDYGLHGTYWHNNFGTPMSRGCVNLTIDDAAWLFNWASVGTIVNVHY
jgi:lipoprotein-anchoring transpeptidase ErfK/SrfK